MTEQQRSRIALGKSGRAMVRKNSGRFWSEEAEEIFFDHLAATCNVTASAQAAGFTTPTVYDHRRRRPEFAARWQVALEQGYARLELALLEAANESMAGRPFDADRPIPTMTVDQALSVLRAHRLAVRGVGHAPGRPARRRGLDEVRASILQKVRAIRALGADGVSLSSPDEREDEAAGERRG